MIIGCGTVGTCGTGYWLSLQEVPYTGRSHAVLLPVSAEVALGKETFDNVSFERHSTFLYQFSHRESSAWIL